MDNKLGIWGKRYLEKELTEEEKRVFELRNRFMVRFGRVHIQDLRPFTDKNGNIVDLTRWSYYQPGRGLLKENMWGGEIEIKLPRNAGTYDENKKLAMHVHFERCADYPEIFALPPGYSLEDVVEWRKDAVTGENARKARTMAVYIKWFLGYVPVFTYPLICGIVSGFNENYPPIVWFFLGIIVLFVVGYTPKFLQKEAKNMGNEERYAVITRPPKGKYGKNKKAIDADLILSLWPVGLGLVGITVVIMFAKILNGTF